MRGFQLLFPSDPPSLYSHSNVNKYEIHSIARAPAQHKTQRISIETKIRTTKYKQLSLSFWEMVPN